MVIAILAGKVSVSVSVSLVSGAGQKITVIFCIAQLSKLAIFQLQQCTV